MILAAPRLSGGAGSASPGCVRAVTTGGADVEARGLRRSFRVAELLTRLLSRFRLRHYSGASA
jgi:hypothetical protein